MKIKVLIFFLAIFSFGFAFANKKKSRITENTVANAETIDNQTKKDISLKTENIEYKFVVFDISNCFWQKTLYEIFMSLKKRIKIPIKGYFDLLQCGVSYALGNLDAKRGYQTFFKYMNNMSKDEIKDKCSFIWEQDCKNFIYKDVADLFKTYKKQGLKLIMVDAGISELYEDLLNVYDFDYVFTANLEYKDGKSTGKLLGEPCSGIHKYNVIKKLIEEDLGGFLKETIFYANSNNDIPLLEHVGKPIAVNPNKKLKHKALRSKWEILNFTEVINEE